VDLAVGIGITLAMMGLIFVAEWGLGWLTVDGFSWTTEPPAAVGANILVFFVIFVLVGWNEELMSRGYHLQTIASGLNLFWGVMLSSVIFGLLHLGNPNATWIGAAGIFFAGVFLGYAYVRTGQLWLSIGLHIGWNFFEGVVFGFPVSGLSVHHLARISISGPELWTGGSFGPEAGLVVLPAIAVGLGLIHLYTRRYTRE
jgi:membrane protease YdiL (CAAX protease family)